MKNIPLLALLFSFVMTVLSSCSIEKRVYRNGYFISLNKNYKSISKEEINSKELITNDSLANSIGQEIYEKDEAMNNSHCEFSTQNIHKSSYLVKSIQEKECLNSFNSKIYIGTKNSHNKKVMEKLKYNQSPQNPFVFRVVKSKSIGFFSILTLIIVFGMGHIFALVLISLGISFLLPFAVPVGIVGVAILLGGLLLIVAGIRIIIWFWTDGSEFLS